MNATDLQMLAMSFNLTFAVDGGEFVVTGSPRATRWFMDAAIDGGATYLGNVSTFAPGGPATSSTRRFALSA